ncbi:hypothetical protein HS141_10165 [Cetobacterium somerae]|uniref:hypothetical protein n=1 Tax=Cetobacterium somerae TaxID=188913 RepID=UPI00211EBDBA|nr:hypothetical protein [Cetobacterium somerae]MCQ9627298.1 hypothetical protein [Cetobacterium somerae]
MKKLVLISCFLLSVASFACGWARDYDYGYGRCYSRTYNRNNNYHRNNYFSEQSAQILNSIEIKISEKELELSKTMNSNNINWDNVNRLNKDIYELKSEYQMQYLKLQNSN